MKKIVLILSVMLLLITCFTLSSCSNPVVKVESSITLDSDFIGYRNVTIKYPLSAKIDNLLLVLNKKNPAKDIQGVEFEYLGVEDDGYNFEISIDFSSRKDYLSKIKALIGREANVYITEVDTILTKGIRMKENFDVSDLVSWMEDITKENSETTNLSFSYDGNIVSYNDEKIKTGTTIDFIKRSGIEINSIDIETTNTKDGTFNRTFVFNVPHESFDKAENKIISYFENLTIGDASYAGWDLDGFNHTYTVKYDKISLEELNMYTALLLNSDEISIVYKDTDNSSTPLTEGLTFLEDLNTFSYMGKENKAVKLNYTYHLPIETIHGEAAINTTGQWDKKGEWKDSTYKVSFDSDDLATIRICDGKQYSIKGINFTLESYSDNTFVKTTDFIFSKNDNEALQYSYYYFKSKDVNVSVSKTDKTLICRIECRGTAAEITDQLIRSFGSGNFMTYSHDTSFLSLSEKTELNENINIGYMLNGDNLNVPMRYTIKSFDDEKISSVKLLGDVIDSSKKNDKKVSFSIKEGNANIQYSGIIINYTKTVIFIIFTVLIFFIAVFIAIFVNYKYRKRKQEIRTEKINNDKKNVVSFDFYNQPEQTTMFSIKELRKLADENKNKEDKTKTDNTDDKESK